ncbi:MAG: YggT family protein [Candidatus Nanopelagicales bacterium]
MGAFFGLLATALWIYWLVLIGRLIFDWVQVFARDWNPRGPLLIVAEGVYTATDPPLRLLRRFIPPLRLGQVSLDLSFLVLILAIGIAISVLSGLAV